MREPGRQIDERLADWVDGRMSERDHERFVAELRVNPKLRQDLEQYERTVATIRSALQAPTRPVQIADRVLDAIRAGDAAAPRPIARLPRTPRSLVWSLVGAAALLGVAMWVNTWGSRDPAALRLDAQREQQDELHSASPDPAAGVPKSTVQPAPTESAEKAIVEEQADPKRLESHFSDSDAPPDAGARPKAEAGAGDAAGGARGPADAVPSPVELPGRRGGAGPAGPSWDGPPLAGPASPGPAGPGAGAIPEGSQGGGGGGRVHDMREEPSSSRSAKAKGDAPAAPANETPPVRELADTVPPAGRADVSVAETQEPQAPGAKAHGEQPPDAVTGADDFYVGATRRLRAAVETVSVVELVCEALPSTSTLRGLFRDEAKDEALAKDRDKEVGEIDGSAMAIDRLLGEFLAEQTKWHEVAATPEALARARRQLAAAKLTIEPLTKTGPALTRVPLAEPGMAKAAPEPRSAGADNFAQGAPVAAAEVYWLVDGPKDQVQVLLRQLALVAKERGAPLRYDQAQLAAAAAGEAPSASRYSAPFGATGAAPSAGVPAEPDVPRMRLVVRFVLAPK